MFYIQKVQNIYKNIYMLYKLCIEFGGVVAQEGGVYDNITNFYNTMRIKLRYFTFSPSCCILKLSLLAFINMEIIQCVRVIHIDIHSEKKKTKLQSKNEKQKRSFCKFR